MTPKQIQDFGQSVQSAGHSMIGAGCALIIGLGLLALIVVAIASLL